MTDVLVVGAGPTGLTLACLLRAQGVDARVVDRLAEPAPLAKAMVVWSRSLEILAGLGVAEPAVAAGIGLKRARYLEGDRLLASVRTNRIRGTRWQPLILPQHRLEGLLRERLGRLGGGVEWGTEVTSLVDSGEAVIVTTRTADGTSHSRHAAYAVGCDGLRSVVRTAAGIRWRDSAPYEETFVLGDVEAHTALDRTAVHQFLGRTGVSVAIPMPAGLWRVVGYLDGVDREGVPERATLQRLLDDVGHVGTTVGTVHWSGTFRVVRRLADDFRKGRLLLAGDAAHVHSPAGGQGLNTGIQDAHNLAWKLSLVVRGGAGDELLDSYTAERRPIAEGILAMTELQDKYLFGARSLPARLVRNGVLRAGGRSGVLERGLIPNLAQVTTRYKGSTLNSAGDRRGGRAFAPGRLVPDLAGGAADGSEPDDLRAGADDGAVTIVALPGRGSSDLSELEALVRTYHGTLRLRTPLTPPAGLRSGGRGLLLGLRPDGHIGFRGPLAVTPALRLWLHATSRPAQTPA